MNKRVLIIITTYNSSDYIGDCLSSLAKVNYPTNDFEILVIDNDSHDGSVDYIKNSWPQIKLVETGHNLGFAAGNNVGFKYAIDHNFGYVYLLNQDTVVDPDFLVEAVKVAESNEKNGAVQSKLLLHQTNKINSIGNQIHYLGFAFAGGYQLPNQSLKVKEIAYPSGASVLIKVSVLKEVGFFNPDFFMYHEDTDLGWRIWLYGYKVLLAPDSVVYHKYEFSRSIKKYYYMERNRRIVIMQNYHLGTVLLILPALILMDLAMLVYSFPAGWGREYVKSLLYFLKLSNWKKIIKNRKLVQKNRRVSDRFMAKKIIGKIEFQDLKNPLLIYLANPVLNFYWQVVKRVIWW